LKNSLEDALYVKLQKGVDIRYSSKGSLKAINTLVSHPNNSLESERQSNSIFDKWKANVPLLMLDLEPQKIGNDEPSGLQKQKKKSQKIIVSSYIMMKRRKD